jgi:serine/threonine-protein kinase
MALEPPMRRRSPGALISWSRLLAGRFTDPLVGRDVMVGALAGLALTVLYALARVAPAWLGRPAMIPIDASVTTLASPWYTAYYMFLDPAVAVAHSLTALFFLYVLHAISGRAWAARLLFLAILIPPTVVTWETTFSSEPSAPSCTWRSGCSCWSVSDCSARSSSNGRSTCSSQRR